MAITEEGKQAWNQSSSTSSKRQHSEHLTATLWALCVKILEFDCSLWVTIRNRRVVTRIDADQ